MIALVITIIVMLILVGVTLSMISGENGILGKAEKTVEITNESAIKEEIEMAIAEHMIGYYTDGIAEGKTLFEYMADKLTGYETPSGATLGCETDGSITYTDKKGNTVLLQMNDEGQTEVTGKVMIGGEIQDTIAPKVKVNSTTINSITFTATDGVGVVAYAVTQSETAPTVDADWTSIEKAKKYTTTVSEKTANQTYYVWAKDEAGNVSTSVKAVTQTITYTIKYDGNDETSGSTASSTHEYGTAKNLTSNGFEKAGYAFKGWSTNKEATTATYQNGGSVKDLSSNNGGEVTLYAIWIDAELQMFLEKGGIDYSNFTTLENFIATSTETQKTTLCSNMTAMSYLRGNANLISKLKATSNYKDIVKYMLSTDSGTNTANYNVGLPAYICKGNTLYLGGSWKFSCTLASGGYSMSDSSYIRLHLYASEDWGCTLETNNTIDMSKYSKLVGKGFQSGNKWTFAGQGYCHNGNDANIAHLRR